MKLQHLFLGSLLVLGASAQALTPVAKYGRLIAKSVGGKGGLYDSTGTNQVTLRGMSMFWSSEPDGYNYDHPQTVAWLQSDWLVSVLRVPVGVVSPSTVNKGYLDDPASNLSRVLAVVNGAIAQGIYVIVDWHALDGSNSGSASTNGYTTQAVSLFGTLAAQFKNTPNIMWEVWNEPTGSNSDVVTHANACITAIRNAGNKNLVIVGSSYWSSQPDQIGNVTDPQNNVAYSLHFYADAPGHAGYVQGSSSPLANALNKGRAVFVTEWGTTGADGQTYNNDFSSASAPLLAVLDQDKVSSCNWDIGTQHMTPGDLTTPVQGSAAIQATAAPNGNWAASDLTPSGTAVRNYLRTANAGLFTLPDTSLKIVAPLTATPASTTTDGSIHFTATFSKSISYSLVLTGQTSKATYTKTSSGNSLDFVWTPASEHGLAKPFVAEKVTAAFSGLTQSGTSTTVTLTLSTSIQPTTSHRTALAWNAQGLHLPQGAAVAGNSYAVRVLDLRGHEIGGTRSALAREGIGDVVLDLAPPTRGSGVAFVDLAGPDGQRSSILLPPVR
jgi:endoglucanase